jgi:hypothetical protein
MSLEPKEKSGLHLICKARYEIGKFQIAFLWLCVLSIALNLVFSWQIKTAGADLKRT